MLIAVLSDSHDRPDLLNQALTRIRELGCTTAIHLGDYCAPFMLVELGKSGLPWYGVWGNVDGDRLLAYRKAAEYPNIDLADGDFRELELDGKKLFLTHYPEIARIAALTGNYDAVFHGHDHVANQEVVGKTLLANPGELCGARFGKPTFATYNTDTNTFTHYDLTSS